MSINPGASRLRAVLNGFAGKRILVIGDLMLDEFICGKVSRISPEAPVPIVNVTGESYYPGGAANVARNLCEFTKCVSLMGIVGTDSHGARLMELMRSAGVDVDAVQCDESVPTTVKTRIIARHQQVVRVDRERLRLLPPLRRERAVRQLEDRIAMFDAIVVADYGKGFLTQEFAAAICATAARNGKVLAVDPHPQTSLLWHGATAIKPNRGEAFAAAGVVAGDPVIPVSEDEALLEVGRLLLDRWRTENLLITLGENGMLLLPRSGAPYHTPTRAQDVFDVSGAGDTAISVFTLGLATGASAADAAELANRASGIVVGKLGTATVTAAELAAICDRP